VLDELLADVQRIIDRALDRLETQRRRPGAVGEMTLWDQWEVLLHGPIERLAATMVGLDEASKLLRSTTPFVGIIHESRRDSAFEASRIA
jgi:hypothetical protein